MPTENRSSNTEMVSVPPYIGLEPLVGRYYPAQCRRCGWVGSSEELTEDDAQCTRDIGDRLCLGDCDELERHDLLNIIQAMAAPQSHPAPIAWMVGTAFWWTKEEAERDAAATGLPIVGLGPMTGAASAEQQHGVPVAWLAKSLKGSLAGTLGFARYDQRLNPDLYEGPFPVFRHADSGEVERLREALAENKKAYSELEAQVAEDFKQIDDLRAQLAERDALLREVLRVSGELAGDLWERIAAALSANAEPSAPVEYDHDALVAAVCVLRSQGLGNLSEAVEAARAALERKPS